MDTMSALRIMPVTGDEVKRFTTSIVEGVQNGQYNPLEVLVILRALENVSENVREAIKDNIMTAADRYNEKTFEVFGARVEKSEVGVAFDYPSTGDREWYKFNLEALTAADRRKERESFLRALREPMTVVDTDSGEVYEIRPPLKKSKSGLKVFIK